MDLRLETKFPERTTSVIEVGGELDCSNCDALRTEIARQSAGDSSYLIINMSDISFIDSTGLGVLVGGLKRMREKNGRFALVCAHPRVMRILEISGLVKVFSIYRDLQSALSVDVADRPTGEEGEG